MGDEQQVKALIGKHANVNCKNIRSRTPLMSASERGHLACVKSLLAAGADPDILHHTLNETALSYAIAKGHEDCVKALVAGGAHVDVKDHQGEAMLVKAARSGDVDLVKALIAAGANVNAEDKKGGDRILDLADPGLKEILRAAGAKTKVELMIHGLASELGISATVSALRRKRN